MLPVHSWLYIGDGKWHFSEAVNASQSFHIIDGLKPGTKYTVRLMAKNLLDNASFFEDVIQTQVKGEGKERSLSVVFRVDSTSIFYRDVEISLCSV